MAHSSSVERGSILVVVAFLATLLGILTLSMLTLQTADTEGLYNHLHSTKALTVTEAGLEHAIQMLRANSSWQAGFTNYPFPPASGSTYSVTVDSSAFPKVVLVATGNTGGFTRKVSATVTVTGSSAPYVARVDSWVEL